MINYTKIYQIGDVHIRLYKRHKEYQEVFQQFIDYISKDPQNSLVVITGDVVHNKIDLSPELVSLTSKFLKNIADIMPVIMIPGNHDLSITSSRLDALSPIVNALDHKNIHYFKDSGVYTFGNIDFGVFSITDKNWPVDALRTQSNIRVALYHGLVSSATTDTGFLVSDREVPLQTFDKYDITMLGDIHMYQELSPNVVYAGSMIQQGFGEKVSGHGFVEWDLINKTHSHKELRNNWCYYSLLVENGQYETIPFDIPKNLRLRIFSSNTTSSDINKIITVLKYTYNIEEVNINKLSGITSSKEAIKKNTIDISDVSNQNNLIYEYLKYNSDASDTLISEVCDVNKNTNNEIKIYETLKGITWKLLKFEFSNMFCYGENNVIDFEGKRGIYGLFAKNAEGKTSVFDALMFCLFDKSPRAYKAINILNNRKNKFSCKATINVNDEIFIIERNGSKKKDGSVKVDVSFSKTDKLGETTLLNGIDRNTTNSNIRQYFGSYDDFVLTNISIQHNNSAFLEKGQSDRKDTLGQFLGIDIYDKLYDIASEKYKEINTLVKEYSVDEAGNQLSSIQQRVDELEKTKISLSENLQKIKTDKDEIETLVHNLISKKEPIDPSVVDIISLEKKLDVENDKIKKFNENMNLSKENKINCVEKIEDLSQDLIQYATIEQDIILFKDIQKNISDVRNKNKILESTIILTEKNIEKLSEYKYNPDCNICLDNAKSFIQDMTTLNREVAEQRKVLNSNNLLLNQLMNDSLPYTNIENEYSEYVKKNKALFELRGELSQWEWEINHISQILPVAEQNVISIQKNIETFYEMKDSIKNNSEIDKEISNQKSKLTSISNEIKLKDQEFSNISASLVVEEFKKKEILKTFDKMNKLSKQQKVYEYYLSSISRDGIPYQLISKTIPILQEEINNILSQIVDFTISMEMDGKNINIKIIYDSDRNWPLELASGMEKFVSGLAIRIALISISSLPKPTFLILDEGFGALSSENLMNMKIALDIIKHMFDWIIIITHLDTMKDMVDYTLNIQKEDGFSKIEL